MMIPEEAFKALLREIKVTSEIESLDNKKFLWLLTHTDTWKALDKLPSNHIDVLFFTEAMFRLVPELAQEGFEHREWGWDTPEGEIRYI